MKIILVSDTRTGSTVVYQTLIDIYGVGNVLKLHLDGIYNKLSIVDGELKIGSITEHHSIDKDIDTSLFKDAKFVFVTRDKYDQILSGVRVKYSLRSTNDITVDLVEKHFREIIQHRIENYKKFQFNHMAGLHNHFVYFMDWFTKITPSDVSNVLLLPYKLFNNKFDYLFSEYEKFFGNQIDDDIRNSIIKNRSRGKNLEISDTMNSFNKFDNKSNIHGLHVSSDDNDSNIQGSDIYRKSKELLDIVIKDEDFRMKFIKYQKFNDVKYINKKILTFGDSHSRVFKYIDEQIDGIQIDSFVIGSSSAQGTINPNSVSNFLNEFTKFIDESNDISEYDKIVIMVGEIDCGSLIWTESMKKKTTIDHQLSVSTGNLFEFIKKYVLDHFDSNKIVICGSILPTIADDVKWGNSRNIRKGTNASQSDKTKLTIEFNNILKEFSINNNINYIDITDDIISDSGLIDSEYLDDDELEHHLPNDKIWKFWYNKIKTI